MKLIIAGGRKDYVLTKEIQEVLTNNNLIPTEIISGGATGIDSCGEQYAKECKILLALFPAEWNTHGKAAGPIRNKKMADYADYLVAFWDGKSKGTKNMINEMNKLKKPVIIVNR